MRHGCHKYKLGVKPQHRKALVQNLSIELITHGKIKTTETKAKAKAKPIKKFADGGNTGNPNALTILNPEPGVNYGPGGNNPDGLQFPTPVQQMPFYGNPGGPNFNPTFNNSNTMNANGGGYGGGDYNNPSFRGSGPTDGGYGIPRPYNPYGNTGGTNFNPVFNNTNTMNANGGYGGNDGGFGGANPMSNPAGQQNVAQPQAQAPAPAAGGAGSVNLLPGLFGAK